MFIESEIAAIGKRRVTIQRSNLPASVCLLFLDGELYLDRVGAPTVVDRLIASKSIPPANAVYLSYGNSESRHIDFTCNASFTRFLTEEFLTWIDHNIGRHAHYILCGLSLSGLAAIHAASTSPNRFRAVISQSPSAWWHDEWLRRNLATDISTRIWLSVGNQETQENVSHPPTPLIQIASQLDSCRRLTEALEAASWDVRFSQFEGGHDPACWSQELPSALQWALTGKTS